MTGKGISAVPKILDGAAEAEPDPSARCGPTQRGGLCRDPPMAGAERYPLHVGPEPTHDQRRAQVDGMVYAGLGSAIPEAGGYLWDRQA
jgi:hypothetical protein